MFKPQDVLLKKNLNTALQKAESWTGLVARVQTLETELPEQIKEVKALIPNKEVMEALSNKASGFAIKTEVEKDYVKKTDLQADGTGVYTKTESDDKFVTKEAAIAPKTGFVTKDELTAKEAELNQSISAKQPAGNYITNEEFESKVQGLNIDKYETPSAAQAKATAALDEAKRYSDQQYNKILGGASADYDTLKEIEVMMKKDDSTVAAIQSLLTKKTAKFVGNIGDGAQKEFTVTHNLATEDVTVSLYLNSDKNMVFSNIQIIDENNIKVIFDPADEAPSQSAVKVVVIG